MTTEASQRLHQIEEDLQRIAGLAFWRRDQAQIAALVEEALRLLDGGAIADAWRLTASAMVRAEQQGPPEDEGVAAANAAYQEMRRGR